ncbi:hypothetical protein FQR65_LT18806 [Abscondita terminalis]|nr:hypothetical protein FQR65_LT18806 [Abscondita terminalis]
MGLCFAPDCNHTHKSGCRMFRFPADSVLKDKWEKLIRRHDATPNRFSVVCSCHFMDGDKKNLPTLFQRNKNKMFTYSSPERRKRQKPDCVTKVPSGSSGSNSDTADAL